MKLNAKFPALAVAAAVLCWGAGAHAACVTKQMRGTGDTEKSAAYQAWEAVLQAHDWGAWSSWTASSQVPGQAPGYSVRNYVMSCKKGGLGHECTAQATLCN